MKKNLTFTENQSGTGYKLPGVKVVGKINLPTSAPKKVSAKKKFIELVSGGYTIGEIFGK